MAVRQRYVEILANEMVSDAITQKGYDNVRLENKALHVSFSIKNKALGKKVEKLNAEENQYLYKKFCEGIDKITKIGMEKTKNTEKLDKEVSKKWD